MLVVGAMAVIRLAERNGTKRPWLDAAYLAGAALNSLDNFVRQNVAWRQRLALWNAAAVNLTGRGEDESALHDSHFLRGHCRAQSQSQLICSINQLVLAFAESIRLR